MVSIMWLVVVYLVILSVFVAFGRFLKDCDDDQSKMMSNKDMEEQQDIHQGDC